MLKMAEEKLSTRRESKLMILRAARNQKSVSSNILEAAIAELNGRDAAGEGEGEGTRMKILVKKEDLKQVLEAIRVREWGGAVVRRASAATSTLEQRLNWMRRRQIMRGRSPRVGMGTVGPWRPLLQTIPEEL